MSADPFDLERFLTAQDSGGTFERALGELRAGQKRSHWMWFVFPQVAGLGHSPTARHYAITSLEEARAYLAHPVLGARLERAAAALLGLEGLGAETLFGPVDAMKLRSSMTLFARAAGAGSIFGQVLERYFDGREDGRTLALLEPSEGSH